MSVDDMPTKEWLPAAAKERVRIAPTPAWVVACFYPTNFNSKISVPITHLLLDRQVHAELRQTFVHVVVRLETMQAVQQGSQWRVEFSPRTQSIDLHSIKVCRNGAEAEHAVLDRLQFLQREAKLEGLIVDGWITLLLLLEDVRPGDILEWSYTIHNQPLLLPECCAAFFTLSENSHVGRHHLAVRFAETRPLKWKSSSSDFIPAETRENGDVRWIWERDGCESPAREMGTPNWHLAGPWIQISDCPDWRIIAEAFNGAWKEDSGSDALSALIQEFASAESDLPQKVDRAITFVQDQFRYLSVNLELGGQIPASPEIVIRRRYGDCKDLAFLLVRLLRGLGVTAKPILVNTALQHAIKDMLPAPGLFNHAVVEYQIGEETRWVDATYKAQGGGLLNRSIANYGLGLPLDATSSELKASPTNPISASVYEIKEHYLVDTTGDSSFLAVTVTANGFYADNIRFELGNEGVEAVAKKRLDAYVRRYSQATRVSPLQYRDDREANILCVAEVLEIKGFLKTAGRRDRCWLEIENRALAGILPIIPADAPPRRMPLAIPYPCKIVHKFEVEMFELEVIALPAYKMRNEFFEFTCSGKGVRKYTTGTFTLTTLAGSIPVNKLAEYKGQLTKLSQGFVLRLSLPVGQSRLRKRNDFGALPVPRAARSANEEEATSQAASASSSRRIVPSRKIAIINSLPEEETTRTRADMEKVVLLDSLPKRRRSKTGKRRYKKSWGEFKKTELIPIAIAIAAVVILVGGLLSLRWFFGN